MLSQSTTCYLSMKPLSACQSWSLQEVRSVAVLPDGRVVSGSEDNTVRIWNPSSGECERVLEGHSSVSPFLCLHVCDGVAYLFVSVLLFTSVNEKNYSDVFTIDY